MVVANFVYGLVKANGGGAGLDEAVKELSLRHKKTRRNKGNPTDASGG